MRIVFLYGPVGAGKLTVGRELARLTGLPLAVGVALAETLERLGVQVGLKWPNDVLAGGAKLSIDVLPVCAQGGARKSSMPEKAATELLNRLELRLAQLSGHV